MKTSEFVITRVPVLNIFFQITVSYWPFVWMRHGKTRSNKTFRLHERFCIIYNKKLSSFRCFFCRDRYVSIKPAICKFLPVKFSKHSKLIAPNVFPNILILMPLENFSPHYQSGFQLNPGKINI